jgi:alpha-glucosidase
MTKRWKLALALALTACGTHTTVTTTDPDASADAAADATGNPFCVVDKFAAAPASLQFQQIETFAGDANPMRAVAAFRTAQADGQMKYGGFLINEHDAGAWQAAASFTDMNACPVMDAAISMFNANLADSNGKTIGSLAMYADGTDRKSIRLTATASDKAMNRASIAWKCQKDEHFIGLGGQSWDVDHRGQTVPLWVSEDGIGKLDNDGENPGWFFSGNRHSTHSPMPIFISSKGYAVILDTPARAIFHLCSDDSDAVRLENWQGELKVRFFFDPDPKKLMQKITDATGRPDVPPVFAFTPWLDAIYGSANVRRVAQKLRSLHIPVGAIWSEDWRGGVKTDDQYTLDEDWNSDDTLYPDMKQLSADLHAWGFKFLTYNNTFLTQGSDIYDEAMKKGYSIQGKDGKPYIYDTAKFVPGSMLDLSNPQAVEWAKGVYQKGIDQGADGWMADFCEWLPTDFRPFSKEDPWLVHNRYAVDCQKLNKELLNKQTDKVERLTFCRSAWLGSQPLVDVIWAGDQQTDFQLGDGLPSVIPMGIGLGVTGFPYFGSDIGGYMSTLAESPTTKELWFRWVTLGAFSPVMRTHHGKSSFSNWNWESDAESTEHLKKYANLHMKLLPYLFAAAVDAQKTGMPLMRPLALNWPDFEPGWTMTDEYALGDSIVVAPIVTKGATSRTVLLPKGDWYPLQGGAKLTSDGTTPLTVQAALGDIPAFVPAGTMLVLLPDSVDTPMDVTAGTAFFDLKDANVTREIWLWPGANQSKFVDALPNVQFTAESSPSTWGDALAEVQADGKTLTPTGDQVTWTAASTSVMQMGQGKLTVTATAGTKIVARWPYLSK